MGTGEDRGHRFVPEILDRGLSVGVLHQALGALLDEAAHKRPILVQRRPAWSGVLLEGEGDVDATRGLTLELGERSEAEESEGVIEMRSADCHISPYAVGACSPAAQYRWQLGHQ